MELRRGSVGTQDKVLSPGRFNVCARHGEMFQESDAVTINPQPSPQPAARGCCFRAHLDARRQKPTRRHVSHRPCRATDNPIRCQRPGTSSSLEEQAMPSQG
ncbi:hypothetical protein NKR23_g10073 [Pleurostoma richardsiae]|uniref:Uncharacterized protein n=1 Tax=Pleurostoma richardsiae TaxID=41990 RepID=A0AA38RAY8_9PEZI|nr:hypothetical protein NKR23_g10073 [Pleurostoma richardsiae]